MPGSSRFLQPSQYRHPRPRMRKVAGVTKDAQLRLIPDAPSTLLFSYLRREAATRLLGNLFSLRSLHLSVANHLTRLLQPQASSEVAIPDSRRQPFWVIHISSLSQLYDISSILEFVQDTRAFVLGTAHREARFQLSRTERKATIFEFAAALAVHPSFIFFRTLATEKGS
ncbi:hypothetical protein N657DRAFT_509389 [Parathielavia appendiculata]|uniref:Uncharacterized protein n=1 Tax=Parathielavia appendiculata TaxID=2587402 RepID=A0AAN6TXB3_9PEZI|nr:hypothetical protein N657DRAFT_509389 [Parathielavia appendiculata]